MKRGNGGDNGGFSLKRVESELSWVNSAERHKSTNKQTPEPTQLQRPSKLGEILRKNGAVVAELGWMAVSTRHRTAATTATIQCILFNQKIYSNKKCVFPEKLFLSLHLVESWKFLQWNWLKSKRIVRFFDKACVLTLMKRQLLPLNSSKIYRAFTLVVQDVYSNYWSRRRRMSTCRAIKESSTGATQVKSSHFFWFCNNYSRGTNVFLCTTARECTEMSWVFCCRTGWIPYTKKHETSMHDDDGPTKNGDPQKINWWNSWCYCSAASCSTTYAKSVCATLSKAGWRLKRNEELNQMGYIDIRQGAAL